VTSAVASASRLSDAADVATGSSYIASRAYDGLLFIFSPLIVLVVAELIAPLRWPFERTAALGGIDTRVAIFLGVFTTAHLVAVFFRSHLNPQIFARHRVRFLVVPLVLLPLFAASPWLLVWGFVVAAFWDVYHSSMQNFGLCRIWDAKLGNDPDAGRELDRWLAHTLYIAPILAGPSLYKTLEDVERFAALEWETPLELLRAIVANQWPAAWIVIVSSALFSIYYVMAYRRLVLGGYRISRQKIAFLFSVGFTSIVAWGFLPPLEAFFVANMFHNLQYFGIVWWAEKGNIRRVFGLSALRGGQWIALLAYLGCLGMLGVAIETGSRMNLSWALALGLLVTLVHFWYDGFIWSVRRRDVEPG
jgi:hypothetical protein